MGDIGKGISWGDAVAFALELHRETGSHLYADLAGYVVASSQSEIAAILHATAFMNQNRDQKARPEPFELPNPFPAPEAVPVATDDEVSDAIAFLEAHSAFR